MISIDMISMSEDAHWSDLCTWSIWIDSKLKLSSSGKSIDFGLWFWPKTCCRKLIKIRWNCWWSLIDLDDWSPFEISYLMFSPLALQLRIIVSPQDSLCHWLKLDERVCRFESQGPSHLIRLDSKPSRKQQLMIARGLLPWLISWTFPYLKRF